MATAVAPSTQDIKVTRPWAIALLGFVAAIKATGLSLSTISLVKATSDLHLSGGMLGACASAMSLSIAATAVASGLAADRFGRRRLLMWSYVTVGVAALVLCLSPSGPVFLGGLIVTGIGLGAMFCASYAYVKAIAPGAGFAWALGVFGMYTTLVTALSSTAAGALGQMSWRMLFLLLPVMCLIALTFTPRLLPAMPRVPGTVTDWSGQVLLAVGLLLLLGGIAYATNNSFTATTYALLGGGVLALVAWTIVELRAPEPSFPIRLFANPAFLAATIFGITANIAQASATLQFSDFWQYVNHESLLVVTAGMQPFYLVGILGGLVAGRRMSRGTSPGLVVIIGCVLASLGFATLLIVDPQRGYVAFLPAIILCGIGLTGAGTMQSKVTVDVAPQGHYGAVTSSRTTVGQIGAAFALAITVFINNALAFSHVPGLTTGQAPSQQQVHRALDAAQSTIASVSADSRMAIADVLNGYQAAFRVVMAMQVGLLLITGVVCALLLKRARTTEPRARS